MPMAATEHECGGCGGTIRYRERYVIEGTRGHRDRSHRRRGRILCRECYGPEKFHNRTDRKREGYRA